MLPKAEVHSSPRGRYMGICHISEQGIYPRGLEVGSSEIARETVIPNSRDAKY